MTGNTNVARCHNHELAGRQVIGMVLERLIQMFDFRLQLCTGKPEKQDPGVRQSLVEDQLAEIAIGNDQNSLLLPGNRQDGLIRQTMREIARDGGNVVSEVSKVIDKAEISALVKQEFHTSGASVRAPLGGLGETSSPVTMALA